MTDFRVNYRIRFWSLVVASAAALASIVILAVLSNDGQASRALRATTMQPSTVASRSPPRGTPPRLATDTHPRDRALQAFHQKYESVTDRRRSYVAAVEATGTVDAPWTVSASRVVDRWREASLDIGGTEFEALRCFAGGCVVFATYDTHQTARRINDRVWEIHLNAGWPGGLVRTGPERLGNGRVLTAYALLPPDDAGSATDER